MLPVRAILLEWPIIATVALWRWYKLYLMVVCSIIAIAVTGLTLLTVFRFLFGLDWRGPLLR